MERVSRMQVAALRYADNFEYQVGDSMPRVERRAWVAALEYAKQMGLHDNAQKVEFALYCHGRTDLDNAWGEWWTGHPGPSI